MNVDEWAKFQEGSSQDRVWGGVFFILERWRTHSPQNFVVPASFHLSIECTISALSISCGPQRKQMFPFSTVLR
jgi:hypothetical protein